MLKDEANPAMLRWQLYVAGGIEPNLPVARDFARCRPV